MLTPCTPKNIAADNDLFSVPFGMFDKGTNEVNAPAYLIVNADDDGYRAGVSRK